mgnify:CR=1 FL=1
MKVARYLSDDFTMYSGNDDITIPLMSLGASGVISVWANVMPRTVHDMVTDYLAAATKRPCRRSCAILTSSTPCSWRSTPSP